jgi:hypothetical protein
VTHPRRSRLFTLKLGTRETSLTLISVANEAFSREDQKSGSAGHIFLEKAFLILRSVEPSNS